jgi:uncharacterized protein YcbK (DUF882 family)
MIGGSKTSQHTKGEAMDLQINAKGFHFIKDKLDVRPINLGVRKR